MNTIPKFPDFRPFTIDDIKWYYDFYISEGLDPYVDIHPENLLVWQNINNDLMISKLDNVIVLKYTNVLAENNVNIIPLSKFLNDSAVKHIIRYLKENKMPTNLQEIPAKICCELNKDIWQLEDDRNSYEYILDTNQQSLLEGSGFSRQRRRINFFEREHSSDCIDVQYYKEFNDEIKKAFLHHITTMPFNSNNDASQRNHLEPIAIRKNLEYAKIFHKKALIIKINEEVVSLSLISYLNKHTAAINHLKVNYSVQYIFQYTIYRLAKILYQDGINEMNIEQDLGIEGLRIFKERLQPSRFLEKKIIRPSHL
jgi:hypothetical protein